MKWTTPLVLLLAVFTYTACNDTTTSPNLLEPHGAALDMHGALQTVYWQGHGSEHIEGCTEGYHWIAAPAGGINTRPLFYSDPDGGEEMIRPSGNNDPSNAAWHYDSGLVDTEVGATPYITFYGDASKVKLVISNCLGDEDGESLSVTKTANTAFVRKHHWDIAKGVTTVNGHTVVREEEEYPKIWLYTDARGDERATWTVGVTYKGYTDRDFVIYGDVVITNITEPAVPKTINSIVDDLGLTGYENVLLECEDGDGAAFMNEALPRDIGADETWVCTYRVELDAGEAGQGDSGVNTVTVHVLDDASSPYVATDAWVFGAPTTEEFACVHVVDTNPRFAQEYGNDAGVELCAAGLEVDQVATFTYYDDFKFADYDECGSVRYDNTATITETGQAASATLMVNVQCIIWDSAWAMGEDELTEGGVVAHAFCDNGFNNWGWSNFIKKPYGEESWPVYAGAAQCDPERGEKVGYFVITHGDEPCGRFEMLDGFIVAEGDFGAIYADEGMFPLLRNGRSTVAPGQYYIADPLADAIHVIAHINVGKPDPNFGP